MSKKSLHRHYDRLEPDERFRLDVLAMARGDMQESERLVGSCPRFNYTMNDRAFGERWTLAMDITLRIYLELAGYLDRILTMEMVQAILPYSETFAREGTFDAYLDGHAAGARHAWEAAGGEGAAPEWPPEVDEEAVKAGVDVWLSVLPETLEELERRQIADALAVWHGFGAFCEGRLGLPAGKVLRVVLEPAAKRVEELEALAERLGIEPHPETVAEIAGGLAEAWIVVDRAA